MERIVDSKPEVVTLLDTQYRMNEEIMRFSSSWFYDGKVKAAHSFASTKHEEGGVDEVVLRFSLHDVKGIVYAVIKAESDTVIFCGSFETVHEPVLPVKIAVGICTFRREEFVKKTLETLKRETMENPASPLYQNVYVYVSDNGQTLPYRELSNDRIFVMPNRNTAVKYLYFCFLFCHSLNGV